MPTVSNTSPIFNLASIGHLNLLSEQFSEVWIPGAVEKELQGAPDETVRQAIDKAKTEEWLRPRSTSNSKLIKLLTLELHQGEAEAIALALEIQADHLLIDEREGRVMAGRLGLPVTGVLGILLRAKKMKRIKAIKAEIEALKNKALFFISRDLETAILTEAGE